MVHFQQPFYSTFATPTKNYVTLFSPTRKITFVVHDVTTIMIWIGGGLVVCFFFCVFFFAPKVVGLDRHMYPDFYFII
jgi:hypothetical protein